MFEQLLSDSSQAAQEFDELEEVVEQNQNEAIQQKDLRVEQSRMEEEVKLNPFIEGKEFFSELTWKKTK